MTKPSEKSPAINNFLDKTAKLSFGRTRTESINNNICVFCGNSAKTFRDNLSLKEYSISGMCQNCQDKTFGEDECNI